MSKKAWALALTVGLLGAGSAAQAALTAETLGGVDVVCDDDYTPVGASSPGLIWTADANLFKTQYDADNTVVDQIIAAVPTITDSNGPHTVVAGDFNTTDGRMTWFGAMAWAQWLGSIAYGGANDWRLWSALNGDGSGPCFGANCINSELGHLFFTEGGLTQGDAITSSTALTDVFTNMQVLSYWSGTEIATFPVVAWDFNTGTGDQFNGVKDNQDYGWAVRPGQCRAAPPPQPIPAISVWGLGVLSLLLMVLARARLR